MGIIETLLTPQVLGLSAGIIAVLFGLGKIPVGDKTLGKLNWWRKVLPLLPLVLGVAGAFLPGVVETEPGAWGTAILVGLWAGFVAAHGRKVVKRLLMDKLKEG